MSPSAPKPAPIRLPISSPMTPMRAALLTLLATPGLALRVAPPTPQLRPLARAQPPSMSLALPGCAASGIFAVAAKAGCATGLAQLGLQTFFAKSSDPVVAQAPGYSAHQLVALVLMLYATTFGLLGWLSPPAYTATAAGRLLAVSASARFLGATLLGALLAWDIPTCLAVPRLRKPDVLGHHVAMAATALVGCTALPTHYGLYYMGVVELSSIPLTIYDQARDGRSHPAPAAQPVHRHMFAPQAEFAQEAASKSAAVPKERAASLRALRDSARAVSALCFIAVRAFDVPAPPTPRPPSNRGPNCAAGPPDRAPRARLTSGPPRPHSASQFTRVTLTKFVPDTLAVLKPAAATPARFVPALRFMQVSSVSFVGLRRRGCRRDIQTSSHDPPRARRPGGSRGLPGRRVRRVEVCRALPHHRASLSCPLAGSYTGCRSSCASAWPSRSGRSAARPRRPHRRAFWARVILLYSLSLAWLRWPAEKEVSSPLSDERGNERREVFHSRQALRHFSSLFCLAWMDKS